MLFAADRTDLWLMPLEKLHLTVMEVAHSKTQDGIAALVDALKAHSTEIADHTMTHRARLIKPLLSYDSAALALSFVPAAGEKTTDTHIITSGEMHMLPLRMLESKSVPDMSSHRPISPLRGLTRRMCLVEIRWTATLLWI